ncbi:MAG: hypothetical protein M1469_02030 [Bacteroidetes bacterium]|nr:hypothetical protein [Bacteroidota bacterium]
MWHRIETIVAVVVSVLALVLSQFPPLHTYFSKPGIVITLPSRPVISHRFGYLFAYCFVQAFNQGDAPGRIEKIRLYIAKKDSTGPKQVLTATSIRDYSNAREGGRPLDLPLGEVTIQPGENWQAQLVFTPTMSTKEEEEVARFQDEIFSQIRLSGKPNIIDRDLYKEVLDYSLGHLKGFTTGDYYMLMIVTQADRRNDVLLLYGFSVYDFDIKQLKHIIEKYRVGYDVTSFDDVYSQGFQARVTPLYNDSLGRKLYSEFVQMRSAD